MHFSTIKRHAPIIAIGLFLILLNVVAVLWYVLPAGPEHWEKDVVAGKVLSYTGTQLRTVDPKGIQKEFTVTNDTVVFAGRKIVSDTALVKDSIVVLQLDTATTTVGVVKEVRIMTDKRQGKK
ncbi:MAG: hypothetical protein V4606_04075 [Patescibacteria group bacterium]